MCGVLLHHCILVIDRYSRQKYLLSKNNYIHDNARRYIIKLYLLLIGYIIYIKSIDENSDRQKKFSNSSIPP